MKKRKLLAAMLVLVFILAGCNSNRARSNTGSVPGSGAERTSGDKEITERGDEMVTTAALPKELVQIPEDYFKESKHPGMLVELKYDTYESMMYEEQSQVLHKRAIVYLPYGYSEGEKYNVFYLMHGGWSNETTYLGTPDRPAVFKNVLDNGMADGTIQPMIVVCPTYNNTNPDDSGDYSLALRLTENYHRELTGDLIPAVESAYSTYAENTTAEGIRASRDHRAFAGFSMGSVATWRTLLIPLLSIRLRQWRM